MEHKTTGHIAALVTIAMWGTTFISTKILLLHWGPVEILFSRFLLALLVLTIAYPKRLKLQNRKQEFVFAGAGLCGICLYYLLENVALTYTMASNVGVIVSIAPFFTALLFHFFTKGEEKLTGNFVAGFFVAIVGICLISFNGSRLELNYTGDILSIAAAAVWAVYSLLIKKISRYGYNTIQTTRRTFVYGIVFMIPSLFLFDVQFDFQILWKPECLLNLIYLGVGASAICFVTWNYAIKVLGAVKTSVYIYIIPVITVVASAIILKEQITGLAIVGTVLTLAGLFLSEQKGWAGWRLKEKQKNLMNK